MTYVYPTYPNPYTWNGPICPSCGRGYISTSTFTITLPYQPKHRKSGPAQ